MREFGPIRHQSMLPVPQTDLGDPLERIDGKGIATGRIPHQPVYYTTGLKSVMGNDIPAAQLNQNENIKARAARITVRPYQGDDPTRTGVILLNNSNDKKWVEENLKPEE